MDVRRRLILLTVLMCGYVASQIANPVPTNNVPSDPAKQCVTAKNVSGVCAPRQVCDHGTAAIDLSLYATRNYTRPCQMEEVCCPPFAMVHVETHINLTIDFDEDEF